MSSKTTSDRLVVDASAFVDFVASNDLGDAVGGRLRIHQLHAPAHFDAEVLSALGRMHRGHILTAAQVSAALLRLESVPIERHPLAPLLAGAWERRHNLRLTDALYVELGEVLGTSIVTTDAQLAAAHPSAELVVR